MPCGWLKNSQFGILGQAWSISLEWQFYLLAPLLFGLLAKRRWYALCAAIALIYLLLSRTASLIIWVALMALIVGERRALQSAPQRVLSKLLQSPLMRWLGEISYSVYLTHMLVLYAVQHALQTLAPGLSQPAFLAAMLLGVVSATVALSALTYRFIEQPGIAAGRKALGWFAAWGAARAA